MYEELPGILSSHHHDGRGAPAGSEAVVSEATQSSPRYRVGLALGSGIARGWAHIGVLRALSRHGIEPDLIVGTSIGALVGGVYLAGHMSTLEKWARTQTKLRMLSYLDFRGARGGLIGGNHFVSELEQRIGDSSIDDLPMPFVAVTTNLATGYEMWLRDGRVVDALRCAISLPGVFEPIRAGEHWLVDGALVNPVPVSVCQALGAEVIIAVNVNADIRARQTLAVAATAGIDFLNGGRDGFGDPPRRRRRKRKTESLTRRAFRRDAGHPSLLGVMVSSLGIVQQRIMHTRLESDPPDVMIAPSLSHVGLLEFDRAAEIIAEGEAAVERAVPQLRAALGDCRDNHGACRIQLSS